MTPHQYKLLIEELQKLRLMLEDRLTYLAIATN